MLKKEFKKTTTLQDKHHHYRQSLANELQAFVFNKSTNILVFNQNILEELL